MPKQVLLCKSRLPPTELGLGWGFRRASGVLEVSICGRLDSTFGPQPGEPCSSLPRESGIIPDPGGKGSTTSIFGLPVAKKKGRRVAAAGRESKTMRIRKKGTKSPIMAFPLLQIPMRRREESSEGCNLFSTLTTATRQKVASLKSLGGALASQGQRLSAVFATITSTLTTQLTSKCRAGQT